MFTPCVSLLTCRGEFEAHPPAAIMRSTSNNVKIAFTHPYNNKPMNSYQSLVLQFGCKDFSLVVFVLRREILVRHDMPSAPASQYNRKAGCDPNNYNCRK